MSYRFYYRIYMPLYTNWVEHKKVRCKQNWLITKTIPRYSEINFRVIQQFVRKHYIYYQSQVDGCSDGGFITSKIKFKGKRSLIMTKKDHKIIIFQQ